jgi:uncharacterized protein YegJ (DUF2314 family)
MVIIQHTKLEDIIVGVGDMIKITFYPVDTDHKLAHAERMWVIVTEDLGNKSFKAVLDNEPFGLKSVKYGDILYFHDDLVNDKINNDVYYSELSVLTVVM